MFAYELDREERYVQAEYRRELAHKPERWTWRDGGEPSCNVCPVCGRGIYRDKKFTVHMDTHKPRTVAQKRRLLKSWWTAPKRRAA